MRDHAHRIKLGQRSFPQEQANAHQNNKGAECSLQVRGGNIPGQPGAQVAAADGARREAQGDPPIDVSHLVMLKRAAEGRGNNHRERSSHRQFDVHRQPINHGRHHHQPAADPEKSARQAAPQSNQQRDPDLHAHVLPPPSVPRNEIPKKDSLQSRAVALRYSYFYRRKRA